MKITLLFELSTPNINFRMHIELPNFFVRIPDSIDKSKTTQKQNLSRGIRG